MCRTAVSAGGEAAGSRAGGRSTPSTDTSHCPATVVSQCSGQINLLLRTIDSPSASTGIVT